MKRTSLYLILPAAIHTHLAHSFIIVSLSFHLTQLAPIVDLVPHIEEEQKINLKNWHNVGPNLHTRIGKGMCIIPKMMRQVLRNVPSPSATQ